MYAPSACCTSCGLATVTIPLEFFRLAPQRGGDAQFDLAAWRILDFIGIGREQVWHLIEVVGVPSAGGDARRLALRMQMSGPVLRCSRVNSSRLRIFLRASRKRIARYISQKRASGCLANSEQKSVSA